MGEEEWVKEAARLCGVSYRIDSKRKCWRMTVEGIRSVSIVKIIRPYLYGCKAAAADIIMATGANLPIKTQRPRLPTLKGRMKVDREGFGPSASRSSGSLSRARRAFYR